MKKTAIPLHQNELTSTGVEIHAISTLSAISPIPHRDDHFMFVLLENGPFIWEIDFTKTILSGPSVSYIAPGQVHRYIDYENSEGWLVFADAGLIQAGYREVLLPHLTARQSSAIEKNDAIFDTLYLLKNVLEQKTLLFQKPLITSLVQTLTGLLASHIVRSQTSANLIGGQKYRSVIRFKQLIGENHKELKEVKAYAELLHITPLYLNEIVKEVTGFTASYWINQVILLEAKRMLYYTSLDVKQIAIELGYNDHAYFSRYFKKHSRETPLTFRKKNHDLSYDTL
jgi:AraC family transcriptional activator of pobA